MRTTIARWLMPFALFAAPAAAQDGPAVPGIEMWRLDCGSIDLTDSAAFSDGHLYDGVPRTLTVGCYLIRHGERYLMWDTGLPISLIGNPVTEQTTTASLERSLVDQLADIGVAPDTITFVGVSHYHFDHIGQASSFPGATLMINARDFAVVRDGEDARARAALAPWLGDDAGDRADFSGDHDVFGDGSVTILAMPGHTPGHSSLLVRLPETGDILLTGDLYHFREQIENRGVPTFNTDRADTLASMERFLQIDQSLDAIIVIQHDPGDIERLPAFPESAR